MKKLFENFSNQDGNILVLKCEELGSIMIYVVEMKYYEHIIDAIDELNIMRAGRRKNEITNELSRFCEEHNIAPNQLGLDPLTYTDFLISKFNFLKIVNIGYTD
jgi:hypothetical protein